MSGLQRQALASLARPVHVIMQVSWQSLPGYLSMRLDVIASSYMQMESFGVPLLLMPCRSESGPFFGLLPLEAVRRAHSTMEMCMSQVALQPYFAPWCPLCVRLHFHGLGHCEEDIDVQAVATSACTPSPPAQYTPRRGVVHQAKHGVRGLIVGEGKACIKGCACASCP